MTTVLGALPAQAPPPPVSRLALAPSGGVARHVDGAWWPHSADLVAELPRLLAALPFSWPQITHATVNGAMWPALPGRMLVAGHVVALRRIVRRPQPGPDTICLVSEGNGRRDLLIIPPDTPEPVAVRRLAEQAADVPLSRESPGRTPPPPPPHGPSLPTCRRHASDGS